MKILNCLIALFVCTNAYAQEISIPEKTITVHLVHVIGENSLTRARVLDLFHVAKGEYARQTAINLKLKYFRTRKDKLTQTLSNRINILRYYERVFSKRKKHKRAQVAVAILPPIKDGGYYYLAGYANGTCRIGKRFGVAVAQAEETNQDGALRFVHSIVAFMHELGHLLGASHIDVLPATIMHPAALAYIDSQGGSVLDFHPISVQQIRKCVK